jgi:hypothetical protein
MSLRHVAYALPALPGFAPPKTYAAWPVWHDSPDRENVRFHPFSKKKAAEWWHKARRFDRQTHRPGSGKHGGGIGRTALNVYYVLLFDFPNYATGQLDPGYKAIARAACCCERAAKSAVKWLGKLGFLNWQRRSTTEKDASGRFRRRQETNAYAMLPPSNWVGYSDPEKAPPPQPGTWGDHPPCPTSSPKPPRKSARNPAPTRR